MRLFHPNLGWSLTLWPLDDSLVCRLSTIGLVDTSASLLGGPHETSDSRDRVLLDGLGNLMSRAKCSAWRREALMQGARGWSRRCIKFDSML